MGGSGHGRGRAHGRGRRARVIASAGLVAVVSFTAAGCSDDGGSPADVVSQAASAVASAGSKVTGAASAAASQASAAVASATAAAGKKLEDIKGGVDVKDAVTLGSPGKSSDGRATVPVKVKNTADSAKTFAVQVNFRDSGGNLLDAVVVTIDGVAAGKSGDGTARSNRSLSGDVRTEVGTAVRY
ncbi:hypothetical protein [Streptomyces sp. CAU 1734]|uniref:hypothetical protein n=1 Tax=Streptomyces sp. CAU 1734 TaxID=3140360 RepID=UPI0032603C34